MKRFLGMAGVSVFFLCFAFVMESDAGCFRRSCGSGWGFPVARAVRAARANRIERVQRRQANRAARWGRDVSHASTYSVLNSSTTIRTAPAASGCSNCESASTLQGGYYDVIVNPVAPASCPDCSDGTCRPPASEAWQPVNVVPNVELFLDGDDSDGGAAGDVNQTLIPDGREVTSVRHRTRCIWLE